MTRSSKKYFYVLTLLLCVISFLTACGSQASSLETSEEKKTNSTKESTNTKPKSPEKFLKIGGGPMGGGWYKMAALISTIYMDEFDGLNVSPQEGGSASNLKELSQGGIQMGFNYSSDFADAWHGRDTFKEPLKDVIASIGSVYPTFQMIATLESRDDIKTVKDIIDKHIFLGPQNGGGVVAFWRLMEEYGVTEETIKNAGGKISYGNYNDGANMLKDENVDVFFGGGTAKILVLEEVDITKPLKIIPIEEEILDSIAKKGYGMSKTKLPAKTYKGQTQEIPTFSLDSTITVRRDLDEEYVYYLTKFIWENLDQFKQPFPSYVPFMGLDSVLNGIEKEQLHPGALRYYIEVGAIKQ